MIHFSDSDSDSDNHPVETPENGGDIVLYTPLQIAHIFYSYLLPLQLEEQDLCHCCVEHKTLFSTPDTFDMDSAGLCSACFFETMLVVHNII